MAFTTKPASPVLQTADSLYTNLNNFWLFQGNGTDLKGNNNFTVNDVGSDTFSFPTDGLDGQLVDRDADVNTDRLSCPTITSGEHFSVAARIYVRGTAAYGSILGEQGGGGSGLYTVTSGAGFKFLSYPGDTLLTAELAFNAWYNILFTLSGINYVFYLNGASTASGTKILLSAPWATSMSNGNSQYINGRIAFLAVWLARDLNSTDASTLNTDYYRLVTSVAGGGAGKGGGAKVGGKGGGGSGRRQVDLGGASSYPFFGGF